MGPKGVRPSVLILQQRSGMLIERRPRGKDVRPSIVALVYKRPRSASPRGRHATR
jgi:hypothetical protein